MWEHITIESIRILPNDKGTFQTEEDFRAFVTDTMRKRGGLYYFPKRSMKCPANTLVLFQYDGMIRAAGILIDVEKKEFIDERGWAYQGAYRFDVDTLEYMKEPIDSEMMKRVYPTFARFSQAKQEIDIQYLPAVMELLESRTECDKAAQKLDAEIDCFELVGSDREAVVKVRVNQSKFRERLMGRYGRCCLCAMSVREMLIASHIKPWSESAAEEKLDIDNGLLLCPNHDKLFDGHWITFDDEGCIMISDKLSVSDRLLLNVRSGMKLALTEKNKKYMSHHREVYLKKENG